MPTYKKFDEEKYRKDQNKYNNSSEKAIGIGAILCLLAFISFWIFLSEPSKWLIPLILGFVGISSVITGVARGSSSGVTNTSGLPLGVCSSCKYVASKYIETVETDRVREGMGERITLAEVWKCERCGHRDSHIKYENKSYD